MSSSKKYLVTIVPKEVKEQLSAQEWQMLVNAIDKLLTKGVQLEISYQALPVPSGQISD